MTTGTRDDVRIPISEERENLRWLYKITDQEPDPGITSKPLIQKVAQTLRGIRRNEACFDPSVVSFGPYHHGKDHLKPMERYKEVAALWFIKLPDKQYQVKASAKEQAEKVYDEFVAKWPSVSSLTDCYTDKFVDEISDADFMRMMFLDGCFMLYFIQLFLDQSSDRLESSHLNLPLILRDMFLLENQIPYSVLVALKNLKPSVMPEKHREDWAASFFKTLFLPPPPSVVSHPLSMVLSFLFLICTVLPVYYITHSPYVFLVYGAAVLFLVFRLACRWIRCCWRRCSADSRFGEGTKLQTEPLHLLDLLLSELTGKGVDPSVDPNYNFRPISELKAAGIQVSASNSKSLSLSDIKLKKGWIDSYLELPRIIINDSTKTHLLNLAAYEMCPDGSLGQPVITSYIWFLNSLIHNADDVKELRSSNIMLNRLGSDEEVVNLFRELATNLSPNCNAYSNVTHDMEEHSRRCFNRPRMWIGQFIRMYFTSPWAAISLTAATSVIFLTLVQTIYSVLSYHHSQQSPPPMSPPPM